MAYLAGPGGVRIVGTLERIPGTANISDGAFVRSDGTIAFEYAGYTEVDWDGQETVTRRDTRLPKEAGPVMVFVDEDGEEHLVTELYMHDEDEGDDD